MCNRLPIHVPGNCPESKTLPDFSALLRADCGCELTLKNPTVVASVGGVIWSCSVCGKSWFQPVTIGEVSR